MEVEESKDFSHFCSNENMQQWLKGVFQEEDVPSFDETPEFVEVLKNIKSDNEAAEKDARVIIKAEKSMKDFYNQKAEELQLVTDFIKLNSETCHRIERLASLAENMRLKEPSLTNFLLAMTDIEDKESAGAEKKLVTSHHMSVFSKKMTHIIKMNEKLRRYLKSLTNVVDIQKAHENQMSKEKLYFAKKKEEVQERIAVHDKLLAEAGYDKKISHSALVKDAQKLKDLEEHLKSLENKLQAYHSLDPSIKGAVTAIQNKEEELLQLEKDLQLLLQECETS